MSELVLQNSQNIGKLYSPRIATMLSWCVLGFFSSIVYKSPALGTVFLITISVLGLTSFAIPSYVARACSLLAITHIYLAMGTAFYFSVGAGVHRNVQFLLVLVSAIFISKLLYQLTASEKKRLFVRFSQVSLLIFSHMVIYHVVTGHVVTWKYLYDTKITISVVVVILFLFEDKITTWGGSKAWLFSVALLAILVLMSGERKAYLLFGALFAFSRSPLPFKLIIAATMVAGISAYAIMGDQDSYVTRQVASIFKTERAIPISEFYLIQSIADQSDLIREFVNRNAWQQFLQHPWFGLGGTGYYNWAQENFGLDPGTIGLSMNVHGELNRIPAEGGMLGIIVAIVLIASFIRVIFVQMQRYGWSKANSLQRWPLYVFCFVVCFAAYEACDTLMVFIIAMYGLEMARLHESNIRHLHWRKSRHIDVIFSAFGSMRGGRTGALNKYFL